MALWYWYLNKFKKHNMILSLFIIVICDPSSNVRYVNEIIFIRKSYMNTRYYDMKINWCLFYDKVLIKQ